MITVLYFDQGYGFWRMTMSGPASIPMYRSARRVCRQPGKYDLCLEIKLGRHTWRRYFPATEPAAPPKRDRVAEFRLLQAKYEANQ